MAPQQLTFPLNEYPLRNRDKRARLYFQMHALADAEDRAMTAYERADEEANVRLVRGKDGTWEWEGEEEAKAAKETLGRVTRQAQTFYAAKIAPVYRSWWLT